MGTRRGNGEGSAPRRTGTGRWVGQIWIEMPDGSKKRITRRGKTSAEVREKYREAVREAQAGVAPGLATNDTLTSFANHWLDIKAATGMKPSALKDASGVLRNYVLPMLGQRRLKSLKPADIERVLASERASKLAPQTRLKILRVMSSVLIAAEHDGLIVTSPTRKVRSPSVAQHDPGTLALTVEQMTRIIDAAHAAGPTKEARAMLAFMGLRAAEVLALDWTDVDLERGRLQVRRARTREKHLHGSGCQEKAAHTARLCSVRVEAPLLQAPKSRASRRFIQLSPAAVAVLQAALDEQVSERRKLFARHRRLKKPIPTPHPDLANPVIPGGDWVSPKSVTTDSVEWRSMLTQLGFPAEVNLHTARHTAASLMLSQGAALSTVGATLGHSSMASTSAYLHAQESAARAAMTSLLDDVVGEAAAAARKAEQEAAAFEDELTSVGNLSHHAWDEVGRAPRGGESVRSWRRRVIEAGLDPDDAPPS